MRNILFSEKIYLKAFCFYALALTCIAANGDMSRVARSTKPRQCIDKFEIFQNHTMCLGDPSQRLTQIERWEIERQFNAIRNTVKPSSKAMMEMAYVIAMEREAQTWADTCNFYNDDPYYRFMPGRYHVGQNIYVGQNMSWSDVINIWVQEKSNFNYNQTGNDIVQVGNYTQIVHAEAILVGCGKRKCGNLYLYVCNFAPGILDSQINTPYESGSAGQGCHGHYSNETQNSNLCSCVGKFCVNGGTLNLTTCECQCVPGVQTYDDHICELNCTQGGDHVDCASMSEADCRNDVMTPFKCPWLCNVCPYGGKHYRQNSVPMPWETTIALSIVGKTSPTTTRHDPCSAAPATRACKLLIAFLNVLGAIGLLM